MMLNNPSSANPYHFRQKWWIGMVLVMSFCLFQAVTALADEITDANGPPYLFEITRVDGTKEKPVKMYSYLAPGDKVCILKQEGIDFVRKYFAGELYLTISPADNTNPQQTLSYDYNKDVCYTVAPGVPSSPNKDHLGTLLGTFGKFLVGLFDAVYEDKTAVAKGGDQKVVEIPMLGTDSTPAKLVFGQKPLHLVWEGSNSSYWVHIYQDGKLVREEGFAVKEPELLLPDSHKGFPALPLSIGQKYKVEVRGKGNPAIIAEGVFKVEANLESILPCSEMEKVKAINESNRRDKDILIANLLIQNGLLLEADQRLVSQRNSNGIASSLSYFLANKGARDKMSQGEKK